MTKSTEQEMFEKVDSVDDNILVNVPEEQKKPVLGDPEWTEYVLSLLAEKETIPMRNVKLPKADGLRRICTKIFGKVVKSRPHVENIEYTEKGIVATVSHELIIDRYGDEGILEAWGLADAREEHLIHPFNKYVPQNASTKAMGRAYRDALQLQVLVAEELNDVNDMVLQQDLEDDSLQPIESSQIAAIKAMCKKNSIDVNKLINSGPFNYKTLESMYKGTAKKVMSILNGFQSGQEIPEKIKL